MFIGVIMLFACGIPLAIGVQGVGYYDRITVSFRRPHCVTRCVQTMHNATVTDILEGHETIQAFYLREGDYLPQYFFRKEIAPPPCDPSDSDCTKGKSDCECEIRLRCSRSRLTPCILAAQGTM